MKKSKKLLSLLLTLIMIVGLLPVVASAADGTVEDGLVTSKVYDPDTGKLTLEAYATGEVIHTVTEEPVPVDIVLVLDASGSMDQTIKIGDVKNLDQLDKELGATRGFYQVDVTGLWTVTRDLQYRNGKWQWYNETQRSWKDVEGGSSFNLSNIYLTKMNALKSASYQFINTVAQQAAENNVDHKVSIVKFAMDEYYGSESSLAEGNHKGADRNSSYNYTEVVKNLTSANDNATALKDAVNSLSAGGATAADYGMKKAQYVLDNARTDSNKVVVMFTDGEPTYQNDFNSTVANNTVKAAKTMKDAGVKVYTVGTFNSESNNVKNYMNAVSSNYPKATAYNNLGSGSDMGYYKKANSSMEMSEIFETIAKESTEGGANIMLDSKAVVKDVVTEYFELTNGADTSAIKVYTAPYTGDNTFGNRTDFKDAKVAIDGKIITVTNFDFSANWCGKDGSKYHGKKLIIEIPIVPNAEIDRGDTYPTNTPESGVYDGDGNAAEKFPVPEINVAEKSYVIDYAEKMTVNSTEWGQSDITALRDDVGSESAPVGTYGDISNTTDSVSYAPKTMQWNGSDSFYAYKVDGGVDHTWAKLNFVPANNVYYEDDFVTIDYKGTWTTDGNSVNQDEVANSIHGGKDNSTLADDKTYSDGSAHKAVASKSNLPTASFTFTGKGVDVYSRTNGETGTVMAVLSGNGVNKVMTVDNLLKQGKDFYQVPTISFNDLPFGDYTVTIYVSTAAGSRVTYYLDGVRVYNPMEDTTLYDVSERNAQFVEVRDMLLKADDFGVADGIVFTDNGNTDKVATYEAYGPENEVYLAKGQAIMFQVTSAGNGTDYYIGMSAPEGSTTVKMTNGDSASEVSVDHASDLYYKVTPDAEGNVRIENASDSILAISKLRVAGEVPVRMFAMAKAPLMSYASSFSALDVIPYEEEAVDPVVDSTDPIVVPDVDPEPAPDPEPTPDPAPTLAVSIVKTLFKAIKSLFSWR